MFITTVTHVHNDRYETTFSWVLANYLQCFRKQKAAFEPKVALLLRC